MFKKSLRNDEEAVSCIVICIIIGFAGALFLGFLAFLLVDMLVRNILPICAGIGFIIAIPILSKARYYSKTGHEYPQEAKTQ